MTSKLHDLLLYSLLLHDALNGIYTQTTLELTLVLWNDCWGEFFFRALYNYYPVHAVMCVCVAA